MNRYELEARTAKALANKHAQHIELLGEQVENLKRTLSKTNQLVDDYRQKVFKLEDFVKFANEYYPGCVEQYHAIKALEGKSI